MKNLKSILTLISLPCVILCFAGCGSMQAEEPPDNKPQAEEPQDTAQDSADKSSDGYTDKSSDAYTNKSSKNTSQGITEKCSRYTVTLPSDWQGRYTNETVVNRGCIFNGFYHKASKEADCGGHLFSIVLLPDSEDYTVFPSYDYLGMLKTPDGEFNMIALYPTDVQFSEGTSAEYGEMTDDINRIIKTVKAMGGAEFVKG